MKKSKKHCAIASVASRPLPSRPPVAAPPTTLFGHPLYHYVQTPDQPHGGRYVIIAMSCIALVFLRKLDTGIFNENARVGIDPWLVCGLDAITDAVDVLRELRIDPNKVWHDA